MNGTRHHYIKGNEPVPDKTSIKFSVIWGSVGGKVMKVKGGFWEGRREREVGKVIGIKKSHRRSKYDQSPFTYGNFMMKALTLYNQSTLKRINFEFCF